MFATTGENLDFRSAVTAQIKHKPMVDKLKDKATMTLFGRGGGGQICVANSYGIVAKRTKPARGRISVSKRIQEIECVTNTAAKNNYESMVARIENLMLYRFR